MDPSASRASATGPAPGADPERPLDPESAAWIADLESVGPRQDRAIADLHARLVQAARREGERRRGSLPQHVTADLDDLSRQAAADALVAVLRKLPTFRGQSRFTTWAYKFALFEMSVALRREAWRGRAVALDDVDWGRLLDGQPLDPASEAEGRELASIVRRAVDEVLTARQREVFVSAVVQGVPLDVLAERRGRTRNATYKTLHDARRRLRTELAAHGWSGPAGPGEER